MLRGDDILEGLLAEMGGGAAAPPPTAPAAAPVLGDDAYDGDGIWDPSTCEALEAWLRGGGAASESSEVGGARERPSAPPAREVARYVGMCNLKASFLGIVDAALEQPERETVPQMERWLASQKVSEAWPPADYLLPGDALHSTELNRWLRSKGASRKACSRLVKQLAEECRRQATALAASGSRAADGPSSKRVFITSIDGGSFMVRRGKYKLRCGQAHLRKLRWLFRRHGGAAVADRPAAVRQRVENEAIFSLLLRYEALQGGGFQAAIPAKVFDALGDAFGVTMECFASPLNSRYGRFCSAFLDTDGAFGSLGSFFRFRPREGSFEANPPFVPLVILRMAEHMDALLDAAQRAARALSFVVIIPEWREDDGWKRLRASAFMRRLVRIDQADHQYVEGKQHLRSNRHRVASFHTSLFVLQTAAAAERWPASSERMAAVLEAFKLEDGVTAPEHADEGPIAAPLARPGTGDGKRPRDGDGDDDGGGRGGGGGGGGDGNGNGNGGGDGGGGGGGGGEDGDNGAPRAAAPAPRKKRRRKRGQGQKGQKGQTGPNGQTGPKGEAGRAREKAAAPK